jgi:hypothetical protein
MILEDKFFDEIRNKNNEKGAPRKIFINDKLDLEGLRKEILKLSSK